MALDHRKTYIELPDGRQVRGRGLRLPFDGPAPDYGLYLGFQPDVDWPHDNLDWPDFRLPRDSATAIERIKALHERAATDQVEVACGGGIGRTGTVISCLAILSGIPADEAVAWTRANYHSKAVETPWQKRWVRAFA